MKITTEQAVDQLQFASEKVSDTCRNLAFTAFAIAWIFSAQPDSLPSVPRLLIYSSTIATITLVLDLIQYIFSVVALQTVLEREGVADKARIIDVNAPGIVNTLVFYGKIITISITYILILIFFVSIIF